MTRVTIAIAFVSLLFAAPSFAGDGCPYSKDHQVTTAEAPVSTAEPVSRQAEAPSCAACQHHAKGDGTRDCVCHAEDEEPLTVAAD